MRKLRMGIIGGGRGAFIGAVHRMAATLDGRAELVAGCMSSDPARARESGRESPWNLPDDRNYGTWQEMLERELARPVGDGPDARIDFVSVVTLTRCLDCQGVRRAGFHVVCDKPCAWTAPRPRTRRGTEAGGRSSPSRTTTPAIRWSSRRGTWLRGTRRIRKLIVEYNQGWLANKLEDGGQKQADGADPRRGHRRGDRRHRLARRAPAAVHHGAGITQVCAD